MDRGNWMISAICGKFEVQFRYYLISMEVEFIELLIGAFDGCYRIKFEEIIERRDKTLLNMEDFRIKYSLYMCFWRFYFEFFYASEWQNLVIMLGRSERIKNIV